MLQHTITNCYLIPIQSFSDIITNSSSETYIVDTPYTAKALKEVLEGIHKQHEGEEYYSGECCGIEVSDFKEYCREAYMMEECDEDGISFESKEDYMAQTFFEVPLSVAKGCLVVRVDYGFSKVDEFLIENFKCIASNHERSKDTSGRIIKD